MLLLLSSEKVALMNTNRPRLAIIVSHPVQYYVPLYRLLAKRDDLEVKVFFTWHGGGKPVLDRGFKKQLAWDIPLTEGYESEVVPNTARQPGTHHFWGLRNPALTPRVLAWRPDAVHLTGYAYESHLLAMRTLHKQHVPLLFRGDSHLLDGRQGWKWTVKQALLSQAYKWPTAFLYVGQANREYYKAFGVPDSRLYYCPHAVDVLRFAEPAAEWDLEARRWRTELGLTEQQRVLLFAGKFEDKKEPVALMHAFLDVADGDQVLVMVGDGELSTQVHELAHNFPDRFRVLPFQNQSRMPAVYRLGDLLVLPSTHGETWGLAINEALACGKPVLVSDRVGCAADLVRSGQTGEVFRAADWHDFKQKLQNCLRLTVGLNRANLIRFANQFGISTTERYLMKALTKVLEAERKR